jgi:ABC-2 type transport system permease protein
VASHIVIALGGTAVLLIAAGLGAGLAHGAHTGDAGQIGRVLAAAIVQLPAAWVVAGIVVAFYGLAPRWIVAGWVALVGFIVVGEVGPVLRLDHWALDISPFAHLPRLPGSTMAAAPIVWLLAIAALLMAAGLAGFRRRGIGVG